MATNGRSIIPTELTIRDLKLELDRRKIKPGTYRKNHPENSFLNRFTTRELERKYRKMIAKRIRRKRGIWYRDKRVEANLIRNKRVKRNVHSVAAMCNRNNFRVTDNGYLKLTVMRQRMFVNYWLEIKVI